MRAELADVGALHALPDAGFEFGTLADYHSLLSSGTGACCRLGCCDAAALRRHRASLQVCGYASVFGVDYAIGDGKLERVKAGAFDLTVPIFATFLHDNGPKYASTQDRTLQVWQDAYGLAFAFNLASTWNGLALARSISAGTFRSASVNFTARTVEQRVEHGRTVEVVTAATIDELSIHPSGANPLACVWPSVEEVEALPPFVATSEPRWASGAWGGSSQPIQGSGPSPGHRPASWPRSTGLGHGREEAAMTRRLGAASRVAPTVLRCVTAASGLSADVHLPCPPAAQATDSST